MNYPRWIVWAPPQGPAVVVARVEAREGFDREWDRAEARHGHAGLGWTDDPAYAAALAALRAPAAEEEG